MLQTVLRTARRSAMLVRPRLPPGKPSNIEPYEVTHVPSFRSSGPGLPLRRSDLASFRSRANRRDGNPERQIPSIGRLPPDPAAAGCIRVDSNRH